MAGDVTANGKSRDVMARDGQIRGHQLNVPVLLKSLKNISYQVPGIYFQLYFDIRFLFICLYNNYFHFFFVADARSHAMRPIFLFVKCAAIRVVYSLNVKLGFAGGIYICIPF